MLYRYQLMGYRFVGAPSYWAKILGNDIGNDTIAGARKRVTHV
jgi:hypothetical protein